MMGDFEMNELMHRKFWSITLQSMLAIFCLGYVNAGEPPNLPTTPKPTSVTRGAPQNQAVADITGVQRQKQSLGRLARCVSCSRYTGHRPERDANRQHG